MRRWTVVVTVLAGLAPVVPAVAQTCGELGPIGTLIQDLAADRAELGEAFCADYGAMARRLTDAELAAERQETRLLALEASLPPPEAILFVDRAQGCPAGWVDVALAEPAVFAGRMPVAIGFAEDRVFRGFRELGGSETHQLTEAELPPHAHALPFALDRLPGAEQGSGFATRLTTGMQVAVPARAGRETTGRAGGAQPLPTMPPFVGLFFCRRE